VGGCSFAVGYDALIAVPYCRPLRSFPTSEFPQCLAISNPGSTHYQVSGGQNCKASGSGMLAGRPREASAVSLTLLSQIILWMLRVRRDAASHYLL
jgi:hypothetical protein